MVVSNVPGRRPDMEKESLESLGVLWFPPSPKVKSIKNENLSLELHMVPGRQLGILVI